MVPKELSHNNIAVTVVATVCDVEWVMDVKVKRE